MTLDNKDWITFRGDYTNATFSAVMQNGALVITCEQNSTSANHAAAGFTQAMASLGASAAPATAASLTQTQSPALAVATPHA